MLLHYSVGCSSPSAQSQLSYILVLYSLEAKWHVWGHTSDLTSQSPRRGIRLVWGQSTKGRATAARRSEKAARAGPRRVAAILPPGCPPGWKSNSAVYSPQGQPRMNHLGLILPWNHNWIQESERETMSITASRQKGLHFPITSKCAPSSFCTQRYAAF